MAGLVLELQKDALNREVRVSDLLRKALVVSRKLNITNIQEWINYELNGYPQDDGIIPDYREIVGSPKVWNRYHGWQSMNFANPKMAEQLSLQKNAQAISELDGLTPGPLSMEYSPYIKNQLMSGMRIPLEPSLLVPYTAVVGILDAVRNKILDWSLELESNGVIGEGMSFTEKEKQAASTVTYQVTNNIGSMNNSQLQQDSPNATQSLTVNTDLHQVQQLIENLKGQFEALPLNVMDKQELQTEISTIELQLLSPKPKELIVRESLKSVRSILEGIAGSIIASGLLAQLVPLL